MPACCPGRRYLRRRTISVTIGLVQVPCGRPTTLASGQNWPCAWACLGVYVCLCACLRRISRTPVGAVSLALSLARPLALSPSRFLPACLPAALPAALPACRLGSYFAVNLGGTTIPGHGEARAVSTSMAACMRTRGTVPFRPALTRFPASSGGGGGDSPRSRATYSFCRCCGLDGSKR